MRRSSHSAPAGERTTAERRQRQQSESIRLAELIARGEIPFPTELPSTELHALAREVRQLRQQRFLRFIAELIARDIFDAEQQQEGT